MRRQVTLFSLLKKQEDETCVTKGSSNLHSNYVLKTYIVLDKVSEMEAY